VVKAEAERIVAAASSGSETEVLEFDIRIATLGALSVDE